MLPFPNSSDNLWIIVYLNNLYFSILFYVLWKYTSVSSRHPKLLVPLFGLWTFISFSTWVFGNYSSSWNLKLIEVFGLLDSIIWYPNKAPFLSSARIEHCNRLSPLLQFARVKLSICSRIWNFNQINHRCQVFNRL